MTDTKRFERDLAGEPRSAKDTDLSDASENKPSQNGGVPADTFPRFEDPAFSSKPAEPAVKPHAPYVKQPPRDTEYAGHPDFSQDAATNKLPAGGFGNSEPLDDANEKTRHSDGQRPQREEIDPGADKPPGS